MKALFLVLLGLYVAQSLLFRGIFKQWPVTPAKRAVTIGIQLAIVALALYFVVRAGVISRELVSPVHIGLGLLAGHLIFGVSLFITQRSWEEALSNFLDFSSIWSFVVEHPYVLSRFIYVGISEEIIWRAVGQPALIEVLGGSAPWAPAVGIAVIAIAFSLVHEHFFRNSLSVSFEFLAFALLLGGLYYWTGSLILVIIIHTVRDIEIAFLEYLVKVQEYGDEEKAALEVEQLYTRHLRGQL